MGGSVPRFDDLASVRALLAGLPGPDPAAEAAARARDAQLTKPAGALGRLEELAAFLAAWQGRHPPRLDRVRVAVFAGWHGVAARGVSAYPAEVTAQMVANFRAGGAAINQLARLAGAELAVVPVEEGVPTADLAAGPAMSEATLLRCLAAGAAQASPDLDLDLLAVGEMGIGNTTAAAALAAALHHEPGAAWAGPGTGLDREGVARKARVIDAALARHGRALADPLEALRRLGGHEIAAMTGAVLGARLGRIPVLLDGFTATVAAAILHALDPAATAHCLAAHRSAEPGHRRVLETLGLVPLLDLGLRLGEASGAALAIPLLRAAVACHTGMATFASAGVSGRQ
jgi:nicotinate-nucleotide--dimethylbenzimidazole phosphoribosyltransferase